MRKPRAIIYDDDARILKMLEFFLSDRGYEVYAYDKPVVCPVNEGFADSCENLAPCADVMISDFDMPKMTGIELFQRQTERGCRLDIKMKALMSGYADEDLASQSKDLGCSFFQKPFEFSELSEWLRKCEKHFDLSQQLKDRRAGIRYDFKQGIEYCLNTAPGEKFVATTFDKSNNGVGLSIADALRAGDMIKIVRGLEVPHRNGVVRWCSKHGANTYKAGLSLQS
jgi:FixJ family two-component response regulator